MTAPTRLDTVYCTDEDLVVQAGGDFVALSAKLPLLALGSDGYFDLDTPWVLRSASIDFGGAGVASNMVVVLSGARAFFKGGGEILAVDSVDTGTLTLRWPGQASGVGLAPGLFPGGPVTGVAFAVRSMCSQIEDVAYELNERFAIDANLPLRSPGDVYDLRILRRLSVLTVLYRAYCNEARTDKGDWTDKIGRYKADLGEALAKATLRWGPTGQSQQSTTRFSTRITR